MKAGNSNNDTKQYNSTSLPLLHSILHPDQGFQTTGNSSKSEFSFKGTMDQDCQAETVGSNHISAHLAEVPVIPIII